MRQLKKMYVNDWSWFVTYPGKDHDDYQIDDGCCDGGENLGVTLDEHALWVVLVPDAIDHRHQRDAVDDGT